MWTEIHISNMKEYHDFYLSLDVILLADVFEHIWKMGMEYYGHYDTLPEFTLDACLKRTKQSLSYLWALNIFFFEKIALEAKYRLWVIDMQR